MAYLDILCLSLSLLSAISLAHHLPESTAFDHPIHTIVLTLTACSFALPSISRALPRLFQIPESRKIKSQYTAVPLEELGEANGRLAEHSNAPPQQNGKVRVSVLGLAICSLSVRIELYRRISLATECTISSVEVFLPFLLAVWDAFRSQRSLDLQQEERPDSSVYESLRSALRTYILRPRTRHMFSLFMVSYGCYLTQGLWTSSNSTYICPAALGLPRTVPLMQISSLVLDFCLAVIAYENAPRPDGRGLFGRRSVVLWSSVMISTSVVWCTVATALYIFKPEIRPWLLFLYPTLEFGTILAMAGHIFTITTYGALDMSIYLTALTTMIPAFKFIWSHKNPFPPMPISTTTFAFLLIFFGRWTYRRVQQALGEKDPIRTSRQVFLFIILCILLSPAWRKKDYTHFHPIDMLMYDAKLHHDRYLETVGDTASLGETVARYRQRYNRNPPPDFDVWFEFAKNKSALIVDDFDQIYDDLLPFHAIAPADLRRQTWEMVSNPWNEISGITIRNGEAKVQENVLPTHRWMLEGVAVLINSFAQYLPDMDLAFNLNDESRVAVPYDQIQHLRQQARSQENTGHTSWSADRAAGWLPIPEHEYRETVFRENSWRNSFRTFGSAGCPPSSLARSSPRISSHSHLCGPCVAPHSLGQFLANWTDAADICHQPDMAHLHGFYLSPAAFKASHQLMPVFSQSKPHGYNDILYPSAWNYMDKVVYKPVPPSGTPGTEDANPGFPDPPFSAKKNVLFWRGATSEGVSSESTAWRGMTRQRLVHMSNNLTTHPHDKVTILLPNPADHTKYKYQTLPGSAVKQLGLTTDIAIVDFIARCGGHDCDDQKAEFALLPPSDFQAHWGFKYLFDLDGAGFSGRFLPFLQSHSLPFKTALFREWYDSRLTAWLHFVPQDIRLHSVWSTLAYFAGVDGTMWGQKIWWKGHDAEGEMIAEAGREWAAKVLRKEDMECYFFRLLLEWGRLTDDRRDELGFVVP
ncbi:capsular associated protein [Cladophialophora carrionii]|uniref:Capsular associated protein n=1 Tax=Cladophialophora carrionii TaxID=86049 RepID=A0A1C1CEK7_9EURO|nr:capsular associated protein [Cladophialophora carrionii]